MPLQQRPAQRTAVSKDPNDPKRTPIVSPAMQCVLYLSIQFFAVPCAPGEA